ncbi:MAG: DUF2179 domain-containing protein [Bacillota bacterium]
MILLIIFLIQISYVTLFTLRTIFVVRGRTYLAAIVSIMEVSIYIAGLSIVLAHLDNIYSLLVYSLSYGFGIILGSIIENKMALGYTQVQVITSNLSEDIPRLLREQGFGVTNWLADGRDGKRQVLNILAKRKCGKMMEASIKQLDPDAFIIAFEPTRFSGGFLAKKVSNTCSDLSLKEKTTSSTLEQ